MSLDSYDYPSRRSAVLSTGSLVATSQPLAAQAGLAMLQAGGNAIDAVLATASHPDRGRADVERHRQRCLRDRMGRRDAARIERIRSRPAGALGRGIACRRTPRVPRARVDECFRSRRARRLGGAARAVRAGAVRLALCRRDPARRGGVPGLAGHLAALAPGRSSLHRHRETPPSTSGRAYSPSGGEPPTRGRCGAAPGMGGPFVDWHRRDPGISTRASWPGSSRTTPGAPAACSTVTISRRFTASGVEPISIAYRDHEVWEIPPNGQGIAALQALGIVEGTAMHESPHGSAASWHCQIEAMKIAFADAYRYVADPAPRGRADRAACSMPAISPRAGP